LEAQALSIGQRVRLHPLGDSQHWVETQLSSVATTSQARSNENPAPLLTARAPIPAESVRSLALTPGMRMRGQIEVLKVDKGVSVPNVAVVGESGRSLVYVRAGDGPEPRAIGLGVRGVSRSQVLAGLKEGEDVLLTPPRASRSSGNAEAERH